MQPETLSILFHAGRLLRPFWKMALFATAMGSLNSFAAVALISLINQELRSEYSASAAIIASFAGLFILMVAGEIASSVGMSFVGQDVIAAVRKDLAQKTLYAPIEAIERFQSHRILATVNKDVESLSEFTRGFSYFIVAFCEALGCAIYLLYLSPPMFLASLSVGAGAYFLMRLLLRGAYSTLSDERGAYTDLQKHFATLIDGAKELKINRERRGRFMRHELEDTIDRLQKLSKRSFARFVVSGAIDNASFFLLAGALISLTPILGAPKASLSNFVLALMYLRTPLSTIILSLPIVARVVVSFANIKKLHTQFASLESDFSAAADQSLCVPVETVELRSAVYAFPPIEGMASFTLGPIDLSIRRGETLFITGENGSGKTTLIKLILGLYPPQRGELLLNGQPVTDVDRDHYRQNFSAIFFDFHLFDDLIGTETASSDEITKYLVRLDIAHKVRVETGVFSTTDLSAGQRKRLALIGTYLEKRPLVVFDEWAAEQDPTFRRIFYTEILQELKRQGKTLIVVSHDDRYFDAADRVIHIHDGRISTLPFKSTLVEAGR
jgi:putative pyoverdin transport system ATP-binding/permease protein